VTLTIRPFRFDQADYEDLAEVRNTLFPEYPISAAEWRRMDERRDAKLIFKRMIAEHEGRPVGGLIFENLIWQYHPRKFYASVWVHPAYQRRGFGGALYERLLAEITPHEPLIVRNNVREDYVDSLRFAARRGWAEEKRSWESRLDVAAFDQGRFAGAMERAKGAGITFSTAAPMRSDPAF
jgi:mycothiol synthase